MALNKTTISSAIKTAMDTAYAETDPANRDTAMQAFADALADAIVDAIKSADFIPNAGLTGYSGFVIQGKTVGGLS